MASSLSFLTNSVTRSSLFRHWTLVILMSSLLSNINNGIILTQANPNLRLFPIPIDLHLSAYAHNYSTNTTLEIYPIADFPESASPLATVPLPNIPYIEDTKAILKFSFPNDSAATFLIDISNPRTPKHPHIGEVILFGFLGVTFTNLCALTGFICIPIKRTKYFSVLLGFMTALAIGALCSTSILVLIPEAMRMVEMPLEFGGQGRTYLMKLGCVLAGALFFFIVEYVLLILPRLLKCNQASDDVVETKPRRGHSHGLELGISNGKIFEVKSDGCLGDNAASLNDSTHVVDHRRRYCLKFSKEGLSEIAPVAWMILFGDGFHNLMDGLTIGAGFTESPAMGITLSLSILFEELPHELGDFAVLISSGFSIKSAICANFASACSAYVGLVIGLIIGKVSSGALYVFAITAGFFLYISLTDMLPSLLVALEEAERTNRRSFPLFVIHVAGLVTGFLCVLGVTLGSDLISF